MLLLYNIFIRLYYVGVLIASLWNKKAAAWIKGRKNVFTDLEKNLGADDKIIWMHCSSAGEFEQGKPIIENLKQKYPRYKILVSFFSPSGYEVAEKYTAADYITYLPLDTRNHAGQFLKFVNPALVVFVKYEFWYHHLSAVTLRHIPLLLVSAVFRKEQVFFKLYGGFFKKMLRLFRHIFVQDEASLTLLLESKIDEASIDGDTRFDRVIAIADSFKPIEIFEDWLQHRRCVVAGSTWKGDDENLAVLIKDADAATAFVIAPHQIHTAHIKELQERFSNAVLYSQLKTQNASATASNILIIDNVGMLARLYKYATITYVGGGFTKDGVHNILEAAVWGKPVLFGPNYKKYREATELIQNGGAFSYTNAAELKKLVNTLLNDEQHLQAVSECSKKYVVKNTGATEKVLAFIQEKRLLTNW